MTEFQLTYEPLSQLDFIEYVKTIEYKEVSFHKRKIIQLPCAFDIETTSTYNENGKVAFMYAWAFGINGKCTLGREWQQFIDLLNQVVEVLNVNINRILLVYIHNLSFEFQFIKQLFEWENIFATKKREPLYARTINGVEFRCSYRLSNYRLEKVAENLLTYKIKKLVGDLDYDLVRHSTTTLTEKELAYIVNDVLIVMCFIMESIKNDGGIHKIPLTNTGYVRNYCREKCFKGFIPKYEKQTRKWYKWLMEELTITKEEYYQLKREFAGGFTHANALCVGQRCYDVASFDETSAYPYVMCVEKFPMSKSKVVRLDGLSESEFETMLQDYCCLFDIKFYNLESTFEFENTIAVSKCYDKKRVQENNGRVVRAEEVAMTLTEVDFEVIKKFYKWDYYEIGELRIYEKAYLPKHFVKAILELYKKKTELKGVPGKEVEYLRSKSQLNSAYGMCVTDIVKDEVLFDLELDWHTQEPDIDSLLEKYNKSKKRFLFYAWGVWVTSYARKNVLSAVYEFKEDYRYSDTDSIKGVNQEKHKKYFEEYNKECFIKCKKASDFQEIPLEYFSPKTIKGVCKPLGVWEYEGQYKIFKTLGAKRYMVATEPTKHSNPKNILNGLEYSFTISGVNKVKAIPYLLEKYKEKIFEFFADNVFIVDGEHTGKLIHTYLDYSQQGTIKDYLGNTGTYNERTSIHLSKSEYNLTLGGVFREYLIYLNVRSNE